MSSIYRCNNCEDTGFVFDTMYACGRCENGKDVKYEENKEYLKSLMEKAELLREEIKAYEDEHR